MAKRKPPKRHYVTILKPSAARGTKGQKTGSDTIVLEEVPCSIETLAGRELDQARTTVADATHRVTMWANPQTPIASEYYLVMEDGRRLEIGHYDDVDQLGVEWLLLCREKR